MDEPALGMRVEMLPYQAASSWLWPDLMRYLGYCAIVVAVGRIGNAVFQPLYVMSASAAGSRDLLTLVWLQSFPGLAAGILLAIAAVGILLRRTWGILLIRVSEITAIALQGILLVISFAFTYRSGAFRAGTLSIGLSIVSTFASLGFPLIALSIIHARKKAQST